MMSTQMIRAISDDAAYRAAQEAREPLIAWPNDDLRGAPFLGEYVAAGWRKLLWIDVPVRPRNVYSFEDDLEAYFMVDASGWGSDDEPALSYPQLKSYLAELMKADRRDIGIGIVEQGQFQIVMQLYVRDPDAKATPVAEPIDWCEECESSVGVPGRLRVAVLRPASPRGGHRAGHDPRRPGVLAGPDRGRAVIRLIRVLLLAGAVALGVTGFYLSGFILAGGSVLLDRWDSGR